MAKWISMCFSACPVIPSCKRPNLHWEHNTEHPHPNWVVICFIFWQRWTQRPLNFKRSIHGRMSFDLTNDVCKIQWNQATCKWIDSPSSPRGGGGGLRQGGTLSHTPIHIPGIVVVVPDGRGGWGARERPPPRLSPKSGLWPSRSTSVRPPQRPPTKTDGRHPRPSLFLCEGGSLTNLSTIESIITTLSLEKYPSCSYCRSYHPQRSYRYLSRR